MKKFKAYLKGMHLSWTVWFGYLLIILPYVQEQWNVFGTWVPEGVRTHAFALIGMLVIVLRFKSTQPLSLK